MTYTAGTHIDHYEIIRMLGHGGMNRVYLAKDSISNSDVVLKIPNDDILGNVAIFERYKREAEIGNRINHPNVQHLVNVDEQRSQEYLVVEYIKGRTLRGYLEDHPAQKLSVEEALRITMQICDALVYCHEHGVFHRDIKPENIMLEENGNVKIIDFGIALLEGARRVTWRGLSSTVGTPDYMSPEQLKGERGSAAADIYAVGVMLYEMLCGHTPFEGENVFAVMNQHVSQDPPSLLDADPTIPPELATVVMKAIRRDADKRYHSMKDMLHDLKNLKDVRAVHYDPEKPQASNWVQQAKWAVLIILSLAVLIIALGFFAQYATHVAH